MNLIYTNPWTRINDYWLLKTDELKSIVADFPADSKFKNFLDNFGTNNFSHKLYQQPFLHIVTETVYHYPSTFVSEKTMKPIANKRPFIIVGPVGSIANIKSLGFRTFNDFWNEEYDTITDPELRLIAIFDIIKKICNYSVNELQSLCIEMENVLNYNFQYYINDFKNTEIQKLEQSCIDNLKPR